MHSLGDHDVKLVPGSDGVFEIAIESEIMFSKKSEGRFPTDEEIDGLVDP